MGIDFMTRIQPMTQDAKKRILIVDDIEANLFLLRFMLEKAGYQVCQATNGVEALKCLELSAFDLIISDILMPEMDGYQLCHECKRHPVWKHIPFIVYTATYTAKEDERFSLALGAVRFLLKPATPKVLLNEVKSVLAEWHEGARQVAVCEIDDNAEYLKLYNERLIHKLEDKLIELEGKNRLLSEELELRKKAESKAMLLLQAVEHAGESVMISDRRGVIEYVNPAFTALTGFASEDVVGQMARHLDPESRHGGFNKEILDTIMHGESWYGRINQMKRDGSFYPAMMTVSPVLDQSGIVDAYPHIVSIHSDLSKLVDMENRFYQAQKMDALGTLVGGIAHDFNNMLAGMTCNLYMARQKVKGLPDVEKKIADVEKISFRAADMIRQMLSFARKGDVAMKPLLFSSLVKETLRFLGPILPDNIDFRQHPCKEMLRVVGDATQIHQVLMNLINNARDAVDGVNAPRITVSMESFIADDSWMAAHPYFRCGTYAHVSVADNGCGMKEDQMQHLFEPFFTTKQSGKGTGLGLAMVYGAIKMHRGFVEAENNAEGGATFHIYVPLVQAADEVSAGPVFAEPVMTGQGEKILLVDNQRDIVEPVRELLEMIGYTVQVAIDGREAIELFSGQPSSIDLVIMDLVMPSVGGVEAAQAMRMVDPDAKIIFFTGYDAEVRHDVEGEIVLAKPFTIEALSRLIRSELDH
ncbi:response regulator [Mariprofundus erugo]|nr:response regulator [Mariprofundus erugo]